MVWGAIVGTWAVSLWLQTDTAFSTSIGITVGVLMQWGLGKAA
jgi:hypothetical protein